ncbi:unnamed protein product [Rotaria socialis]|uniref:Uncharacterized protein n=4 Tax=Rotaria socialis TaxID=392032 RepID=A0A817RCC7_9BILA|nr:unnamed protein product [Rotaria socialis]CAF4115629.1 unnamed protein product [Rotaria socialis]
MVVFLIFKLTSLSDEVTRRLILARVYWDLKRAFELYKNAVNNNLENRIVTLLMRDRIDIDLPIYKLNNGEENIDWNELVISINAELGETEDIVHKTLVRIRQQLISADSYIEGGSIARTMLFAHEGNCEQDLLFVFAALEHEDLIEDCTDQTVFVKIRFTPDKSSFLSKVHDHYFSCHYCSDKTCENDKYRGTVICDERMKNKGDKFLNEKDSILRKSSLILDFAEEPCVSKTNIQYKVKSENLYNEIRNMLWEYALVLNVFENMEMSTRIGFHDHYCCNYMETSIRDDRFDLFDIITQANLELNMPDVNDRNTIGHVLMGSIFGLPLPKDLELKLRHYFNSTSHISL